jgi:hypothetical protein
MKSITVSLLTDPTDRSVFYRASDEELGAAADSDHVPGLRDRDFHAASALAAQAVARLGERLQAGE